MDNLSLPLLPDNFFLVGMMGSGKSTVGKLLAQLSGKQFIDADLELEQRTGVSIATIFDIEGEEGFRKREHALLGELAARRHIVLATGGGAIIQAENRTLLRDNGHVIYLEATSTELMRRVRHDRHRPLLQTGDPQAQLLTLLEQREPWYLECAHTTVRTGRQNAQLVVEKVLQGFEPHR